MDSKKFCTNCKTFHFEFQFVWDGKYHKTCIKYKQNRDLKKQNNTVSVNSKLSQPTISVSSQLLNLEFNSEELNVKDEAEHMRIEIDYFDVGNFEGVANTDYQIHLLVNLDAATIQNMMAKDIANLVVAEIEGGDDYSWK
ncbi:hypothetical protein C2G38_2046558 [Gigaspora rosea]|uniref:Uncharacterized protein n=1 Tax=Gigaspora rosea TaxID=44941 RepID=A0A397UC97_9GLOM|nr:hypothetical protein C2G38_2046558 [Gigaspora rosea]